MRLAGKCALVIGGTKGIGRGIVELFASEGSRTVFVGRDEIAGADVLAQTSALGGSTDYVKIDATDLPALRHTIAEVADSWGRIDILVNNAAYAIPKSVLDSTEEDFDYLFSLNVRSVFFAMQYAAKLMIANGGGSIVNIGSIASVRAYPNRSLYCATKGALLQMTKGAALDLAPHHVRVNCVSPGNVDTWLLRKTRFEFAEDPDARVAELAAAQPVGRLGTPLDIASAVLFLASDESQWVTGANIVVDGGAGI